MLSHGESITPKTVRLQYEDDHALLQGVEAFGADDLVHTSRNKASHIAESWIRPP